MNFLKVVGSSIFQVISLIFVLIYLLGALNIHFSDKNDYCVMTYMFEYPQFVRITVPENKHFPQYGLYAYSEGRLTEKARKMWFDGIPVLFLPGNSGSHMQGRSLASVALRKALSGTHDYHFDYFTVSYNEDLSGLYGGVLQSETEFAAACIAKILSLYKSNKYTKSVPSSVIVVGHSMGGLIAKRLLAYPETLAATNIVITLAAPLEAPVINFDMAINDYYKLIDMEWKFYIHENEDIARRKLLVSFGNGPRDMLMPSGLTASNDSDVAALTTAIPGVWVSPDHVSIVWCKQLVLAINKFLFAVVNRETEQIETDKSILMAKAKKYFVANRSMTLNPSIKRGNVTMQADAFWYEDNRRIYQISRPEIDKTTYLMIRLVSFPQNRFVAIEAVNVDDKDWIFGCSATEVYGTHRYCKQAISLTELSRWSGAATNFGKRKLATVHLHDAMDARPEWTHIVVKVSPTRKPITLNVDINDHASRNITVELPYGLSLGKTVIKQETEPNALYYELLLPGFDLVHQAYLLYVEPTAGCKASQYHVAAELQVPWARNHEAYHYFTHLKRTPMKLRLYKSNPNATTGGDPAQFAKVTILLDPQCTFTISISTSWYHRLAQLVRNYTPALIPYVAAVILLAARSSFVQLHRDGKCASLHGALMSEGVKPYYALVFARICVMMATSVPILSFLLENASWNNLEIRYFTRSLLVVPAYMTALGIVNVCAAVLLATMVFSSQLAHRLLFRIVWRGGSSVAEKVAYGLQKVPLVVSVALVGAVPLSCGAASLTVGAAFYAFMISKMFEEYLEDYVYKLMAKVASRICRVFKSKNNTENIGIEPTDLVPENTVEVDKVIPEETKAIEYEKSKDNTVMNTGNKNVVAVIDKDKPQEDNTTRNSQALVVASDDENNTDQNTTSPETCNKRRPKRTKTDKEVDDELNNLHFHTMMFFLWIVVAIVNLPALLTWARNFKYSMVLKPDTSYHTGFVMSACSACVWQMEGPRKRLRHYESVASLLFTMAVFILALGPSALYIVNYAVTFIFVVITAQQLFDKEENVMDECEENKQNESKEQASHEANETTEECISSQGEKSQSECDGSAKSRNLNDDSPSEADSDKAEGVTSDCDVCSESAIYKTFQKLREKLSLHEDL